MTLICSHGVDLEKSEPPFCTHCAKCIWCNPEICTPAKKPEECECKGTRIGPKMIALSSKASDRPMLKAAGFYIPNEEK